MLDGEALWWPLLLSTLAGLSTTIGAVLAVCSELTADLSWKSKKIKHGHTWLEQPCTAG
jgi:hypothetical protein